MRHRLFFAIALGLLVAAVPAVAHHSSRVSYDPDKEVSLEGKIIKIDWTNPHSIFHVEVTGPDGKPVVWQVQSSTPNSLFRRGVTRDALPKGTAVSMKVSPARDGSMNGFGREIRFPDGRTTVLNDEK